MPVRSCQARDRRPTTSEAGSSKPLGRGVNAASQLTWGQAVCRMEPRADSSLKGNTISPHWKGWCDGRRLHTTDGCGAGEDRAWTTCGLSLTAIAAELGRPK